MRDRRSRKLNVEKMRRRLAITRQDKVSREFDRTAFNEEECHAWLEAWRKDMKLKHGERMGTVIINSHDFGFDNKFIVTAEVQVKKRA